jgi:hypothetical protein
MGGLIDTYALFIHRLNLLVDSVYPDDAGYALIAQALHRTMR